MRKGLAVAAVAAALLGPSAPVSAAPARQAFLVLVEPMPFERALRDPVLAGLGRTGGLGLLTSPADERTDRRQLLEVLEPDPAARERIGAAVLDVAIPPRSEAEASVLEEDLIVVACCRPDQARFVRGLLRRSGAREVAVVALPSAPTEEMRATRDDVLPVAFARAAPAELFPPCSTIVEAGGGSIQALPGCLAGLTSDTTRRPGLVSTNDVWPTLLRLLGREVPGGSAGSPMRVEDAAPIDLHQRYLGYRSVHTAAGLGLLAVVVLALVIGLALLFSRAAPRPLVRRAAAFGLAGIAGAVSLLAVSVLPRFDPWLVLAVSAGGAAALATFALRARPGDPVGPVAVVAAVGMLLVLVDGVLGWRALLMPLIGGSSLEGVRFYGLGNGFGGLLAAGAILTATRLRPWAGTLLLAAAGMLAGLPGFGANLGVALTLFAASGLWQAVHMPGRVALRLLAGGAIAVALLAALLATHRFADVPTHITRAVEAGNPLSTAVDRFLLNVRNTSAHPAGWLPVALLPVALAIAWRRWGPFGEALRRDPAWRDGVVTLALASIVGFLANDTIGVAGMGFAFCSAALVYPALALRAEAAA